MKMKFEDEITGLNELKDRGENIVFVYMIKTNLNIKSKKMMREWTFTYLDSKVIIQMETMFFY